MSELLKAFAEQHGFCQSFPDSDTCYGGWNSIGKAVSGSSGYDFVSMRVDDCMFTHNTGVPHDFFDVSVSNHASGTNPTVRIGWFRTLSEVLEFWNLIAATDYDKWQDVYEADRKHWKENPPE